MCINQLCVNDTCLWVCVLSDIILIINLKSNIQCIPNNAIIKFDYKNNIYISQYCIQYIYVLNEIMHANTIHSRHKQYMLNEIMHANTIHSRHKQYIYVLNEIMHANTIHSRHKQYIYVLNEIMHANTIHSRHKYKI